MGIPSRLRSVGVQLGALSRIARHIPEIRRGGHASASLLLERNAEKYPDAPAIRYLDEVYTWAEFEAHANRWAHVLVGRGIAHGDVVSLVMDNRPEYLFALMGAIQLRAVVACVNTNLSGSALAHAIGVARPRIVVAGSEHEGAVRDVLGSAQEGSVQTPLLVQADRGASASPDFADDELRAARSTRIGNLRPLTEEAMTYLYTSGTTGLPKAAIVTNQRFLATAYGFGKILHEATHEDVIYVALPLYHGTGQWGGFGASLATGACLALRRKFSASSFWSDVVAFGATRFTYIGELCRYLLLQPETPYEKQHGVRVVVGNGLRPDVWGPFQSRFGIPLIREFYGATEGNAPLANLEGRPGMLGRLGMGQAVIACDPETGTPTRDARGRCTRVERAGDTGLLVGKVSRLATFDGYVDAKATEAKVLRDVFKKGDAWFNTGDLVTLHEDDWVAFADRVGDTFRWKGENVSTSEVATLVNRAPGVLESNVYGVVVPQSDGRAGMASLRVAPDFDLQAFAEHVARELPKYARPLFLRLEEGIRVTSTFKHQKVDYRNEGFDPSRVSSPLFVLVGDRYAPLDAALYEQIRSGELVPG